MQQVVIYVDQGVDGVALKQTVKSLQMELDPEKYNIRRMEACKLKEEGWEDRTAAIIIPGGRDVYYHSALGQEGSEKIKKYVQQGGAYLGLCAGAYFASEEIEFEKGGRHEVCAKRTLCFYPGTARGPAYGLNKYSYEDSRGAEAALISWKHDTVFSYFNGGCLFEEPEKHSNVSILSRYMNLEGQPAAVVSCEHGKGRAILSGTHLEYSIDCLSDTDPYLGRIYSQLHSSEEKRREVFRDVLSRLGLFLKNE
jgi:glutamine amidotransferase-like uncharacterized protein